MTASDEWLIHGTDGHLRCWWPGDDAQYVAYHDDEWGRPRADDRDLFEKLCLEGFQAGLSWLTILRKREHFREAFTDFDIERVAGFGDADVERLLTNAGIVRHRGKIEAAINNAQRAIETIEAEGSLAAYIWSFEPGPDDVPATDLPADGPPVPATTQASKKFSVELKRRGWKFVGPTTAYAFFQSMGLVNDHIEGCEWRPAIDAERESFVRPGCV